MNVLFKSSWPRFFVLTLSTMVLFAACSGSHDVLSEPTREPIRFAYDLWPGYYPALIANEQGYFAEEGIVVEVIKPESTDSMLADFVIGKYDAVAVALGDIVGLAETNPNIRVILVSDESAGGDALVAAEAISSITELKGQSIGVNQGGFAELFVTTLLEENGLTLADVTIVNTDAAEIPALLNQGVIQAGHTWEPYVTEAKNNGSTVIFTSADTPGLIPDVIAFRSEVLEERPQDVKAFVRGWFRAVDFWLAHPSEGAQLAAQALEVPPDEISLDGIRLMTQNDNMVVYQKGNSTTSLFYTSQLYVDFYLRIGTMGTSLDLDTLLDGSYLE